MNRSTSLDVAEAIGSGHTPGMSKPAIDISALSLSERIQLAEDLWDSVVVADAEIPLTSAQVEELDRRLDDLERDPDAGVKWEVARARLEELVRRSG